jgi:hypothetical protein
MLEEAWRAYSTGDFDVAAARFRAIRQAEDLTPEQEFSALLGLATTQHYRPDSDLDEAAENYALLGAMEGDVARRQSALGLARIALARGNALEGQSALMTLISEHPDSMEANEAVIQLADSLLRPEVVEDRPGEFRLPGPGASERGLNALEERLQSHPDNRLAPAMHMMAANAYIQRRQFEPAVRHLVAAERKGIAVVKTRGTVIWRIARIAEQELGDLASAEKYYELYTRDFSRSALYYRAVESLARVRRLRQQEEA